MWCSPPQRYGRYNVIDFLINRDHLTQRPPGRHGLSPPPRRFLLPQVVYGLVCKFRGHGMRDVSQPHVLIRRDHTMTVKKHSTNPIDLKALVAEDCDWMKSLIKAAVQEVPKAEMTELLGGRPPRAPGRPPRLPGRLLRTWPGDPHRQARAPGPPGPSRPVPDRPL